MTDEKQPDALRLADVLEGAPANVEADGTVTLNLGGTSVADEAAAELRRLHAEVERLNKALRDEHFCDTHCTWRDHHPDCKLAQKDEQEPIARVTGYFNGMCVIEPVDKSLVLPTNTALYTNQPKRQPLTDEEILEIAGTPAAIPGSYVHSVIRATEQAHGIGEEHDKR